jgi:hypothetical protein
MREMIISGIRNGALLSCGCGSKLARHDTRGEINEGSIEIENENP